MTSYSSLGLLNNQMDEILEALENMTYVSRRDKCIVVLVPCCDCGRQFEELWVAASARIRAYNYDFLCLACDDDAVEPGLVRVVGLGEGQGR